MTSDNTDLPTQGTPGRVPVVFVADERYAMQLAVAALSVRQSLRPGSSVRFYVLDCGISAATRQRIQASLGPENEPVFLEVPRIAEIARFAKDQRNFAPFGKFFAADILPQGLSKAVLLDCDVVTHRDITDLFDVDLSGFTLAAVQDMAIPFVSSRRGLSCHADEGFPPAHPYFNSGVMVLNLSRWRSDRLSDRLVEFSMRHARTLSCFDQDGFNAVCGRTWRCLEPQWNRIFSICSRFFCRLHHLDAETVRKAVLEPWITHFSGELKPWVYQFEDPASRQFYRLLDLTAWAGLRPPRSYRSLLLARYFISLRKYLYPVECIASNFKLVPPLLKAIR